MKLKLIFFYFQINCSVTTKKGKIDLSPLILTNSNYIVKSNDSEFHINVCSPLSSPNSFKSCQGKAICKIERDKSGIILHETASLRKKNFSHLKKLIFQLISY